MSLSLSVNHVYIFFLCVSLFFFRLNDYGYSYVEMSVHKCLTLSTWYHLNIYQLHNEIKNMSILKVFSDENLDWWIAPVH